MKIDYKNYSSMVLNSSQAYKTIENDIKAESVNHSYLLNCKDRITRELFSQYFAKRLICQNHNNNCPTCENIEKKVYPDVHFLPGDGKSLKVEDAEEIISSVQMFGMLQEKKVYILDNFELATGQMQNKILKVLEEPPENVYFLLMCCDDNAVLTPIKSRCKKLYINGLSEENISKILDELAIDKQTQSVAKLIGENYLGKALEVVASQNLISICSFCIDFLLNCKTSRQMLPYTSHIANLKNDFKIFLQVYAKIISLTYNYKLNRNFSLSAFSNEIEKISNFYSVDGLVEIQDKISFYNEEFERNCNLSLIADQLVFDNLALKNKG